MLAASVIKNSSAYLELHSVSSGCGMLAALQSHLPDDRNWDEFLAASPYGHFYQTSKWGQVRRLDGWQPLIVVITLDSVIVGGFQILTRSKGKLGKIGLLLKGPVVDCDDPIVLNFTIEAIKKAAKANRINALFIQPSDRDKRMEDYLIRYDFSSNHLEYVIKNNTVVVDLNRTEEEMFKAIKRTKRQNINTAIRQCVKVREGSKDELETFFNFMLETCKRQNVSPSPSKLEFLELLWDRFSPAGQVKLFVSEYEGEAVTCLMVILLGRKAYLWKFGWSGKFPKLSPNLILYWEIFKWAREHGYLWADLGALDKDLANTLWRNERISDDQAKTYSYLKVSFDGEVLRLSEGFVYIQNPLVRWAYNAFMPYINSKPFLKRRLLFGE